MRQYEDYPIYINVPPEGLAVEREKQIAAYAAKQDFRKTAWLRNVQKRLDEITIDPVPNPFGRAYEDEVVKHLNLIRSTPIGKVTLDSLNRNEKVWIIPLSDEERKTDCDNCAAYVFPSPPAEGGGIRLYYSPQETLNGKKWEISSDDTFFHEVVHALRFGWSGSWDKANWINGYQDQEEFIATIMENLYISSRGKKQFYSRYLKPTMMAKEELYNFYSQDADLILWFKRVTFSDSFIWAMARRTDPPFNPWRDRPELERRWLRIYGKYGVKKFPGS